MAQMAHLSLNQDPIKVHYNNALIFRGNQNFLKIWLIMSSIDFLEKRY